MKKLLFIAALLFIVQIIISCDIPDGGADTSAPNFAVENSETTPDENAVRQAINDDLPDIDFQEAPFRIAFCSGFYHNNMEILAEANIGEVINDAVYKRNKLVEARFNVQIEPISAGTASAEAVNKVRTNILAGSDYCDMFLTQAIMTCAVVPENLYVDLYSLPELDFEKPWWNKSAAEQLTVGGHAYLMLGSLNLSAIHGTWCVFFNKNLADNNDIGANNLYKTVLDGNWTLDKLSEITRGMHIDLNGDSQVDEEDRFGLKANSGSAAVAFLWASNHPLSVKGADGYPALRLDQEKMNGIVQKVYSLYYDNLGTYVFMGNDYSMTAFNKGNILFTLNTVGQSKELRGTEFEYGIIPYPKYDAKQDKYYTMADGYHSIFGVPKTAPDLTMAAVIAEALNAYSYKESVIPYYEVSLKVKYTRDNESVQILDTITDGTIYDFGYFYDDWKGFGFMMQDLMGNKNNNFASYYASRIDAAEIQFNKVIDAYKALN